MAKMFGYASRKSPGRSRLDYNQSEGMTGPGGYEGKEHVKFKDPGYSEHDIEEPEDEPHMKSRVSRNEEHEMEDDYHMDVPNLTKDTLAKHIKRARMKMDAPDQQDPKRLMGNLVTQIPLRGTEDTSGEEEEGPHDMQDDSLPKEHRKKMIAAIMKKKMKKGGRDPGSPPAHPNDTISSVY
jgi:hypothetical protein